jgi:tripeptide aminopeptidase
MPSRIRIDRARAEGHLLDLLAVEGLSGREGRVAALVRAKLRAAGCRPGWIRQDDAHRRLGRGFECGNLIVRLPGTVPGERRLFLGHMDTVPLCRGARPVRRGGRIVAAGATAVGADDRAAVACLVTLVETLLGQRLPHPPLTILFTIAEETGLHGAKAVRPRDLGHPALAFNIDDGPAPRLAIGAIGATRWEAHVHGLSSHAGMRPEEGVSAMLAAARAIERVAREGLFGRVRRGRGGTANVGIVRGGEATNQVTDYVYVKGECRSHHAGYLRRLTAAYRRAFERAARSVRNAAGVAARVEFRAEDDYAAFRLPKSARVVRFAEAAARSLGMEPERVSINGGLDANPLNAKGIPTVTFGAGQHGAHSLREYVDLREYAAGCRLAVALATLPLPPAGGRRG